MPDTRRSFGGPHQLYLLSIGMPKYISFTYILMTFIRSFSVLLQESEKTRPLSSKAEDIISRYRKPSPTPSADPLPSSAESTPRYRPSSTDSTPKYSSSKYVSPHSNETPRYSPVSSNASTLDRPRSEARSPSAASTEISK